MGVFSEVMFFQMLGANSIAFVIAALVTQWRASHLADADFIELWANFSLIVILVGTIKLVIYLISHFLTAGLSSLLQQTGMTVLLFPTFYVVLVSLSSVLVKIMSVQSGECTVLG